MYCGRCGKPNREGAIYCEHCGAKIIIPNQKKKSGTIKYVIIGIILIAIIILTTIGIIAVINSDSVYFSDDDYDRVATRDNKRRIDDDEEDDESSSNPSSDISKSGITRNRSSKTEIVVDNYYYVDLPNAKAADDLIVKDSEKQKGNTANEIKKIENEIINNYKVKAVNLGEMDVETARGVAGAFKYIYDNFPGARNMLSNISIGNIPMSQGEVIAYFQPKEFASSKSTASGYPKSVKSLMCLNSKYFLNPEKLEQSVKDGAKTGHFPKNVSKYAVVVHESGHFLTLVATMKKYGIESVNYLDTGSMEKYIKLIQDWNANEEPLSILKEAYQNYQRKYNDNISFDDFRASISGYAMQTDKNGKPIYHETVAEAFHDFYTNGQNAAKASIEIVNVLKQRVN